MKKVLSLVIVLCMLFSAVPAMAEKVVLKTELFDRIEEAAENAGSKVYRNDFSIGIQNGTEFFVVMNDTVTYMENGIVVNESLYVDGIYVKMPERAMEIVLGDEEIFEEEVYEIKIKLTGNDFDGGYFFINNQEIRFVTPIEDWSEYVHDFEIYFTFKDGSIKSLNQISDHLETISLISPLDAEVLMYMTEVAVKPPIELNQVLSITVKGVEYDAKNPSLYRKVERPDYLEPFEITVNKPEGAPTNIVCPIKDFLDALGCEMVFLDEDTFEFEVRGEKYRIDVESRSYHVDGVKKDDKFVLCYWYEGEIWATSFLRYILNYSFWPLKGTNKIRFVP